MNETIIKWNEDVKRGKSKERIVNIQRHIIEDKNTKIINLKLLREIDKKDMATELSYIMTDVTGKSVDKKDCICIDANKKSGKCDEYERCLLCILDYLIDVNRIKIIPGDHVDE